MVGVEIWKIQILNFENLGRLTGAWLAGGHGLADWKDKWPKAEIVGAYWHDCAMAKCLNHGCGCAMPKSRARGSGESNVEMRKRTCDHPKEVPGGEKVKRAQNHAFWFLSPSPSLSISPTLIPSPSPSPTKLRLVLDLWCRLCICLLYIVQY